MGIVELFLIAVGLSMDAFAVAVCKGLAMKKCTWTKAGIVGLYFWSVSGWNAVDRICFGRAV